MVGSADYNSPPVALQLIGELRARGRLVLGMSSSFRLADFFHCYLPVNNGVCSSTKRTRKIVSTSKREDRTVRSSMTKISTRTIHVGLRDQQATLAGSHQIRNLHVRRGVSSPSSTSREHPASVYSVSWSHRVFYFFWYGQDFLTKPVTVMLRLYRPFSPSDRSIYLFVVDGVT